MDHPEMRNTVFGEVFAELLEARGLEVTPFEVGRLAEDAGLDGWDFIDRMASTGSRRLLHLDLRLAENLDLSEPEKLELALAFTFERRGARDLHAEHLSRTNQALGVAIDLLDRVPPEAFGFGEEEYFRAKRAIAEAGGLMVAAQGRRREVGSGDRPAA